MARQVVPRGYVSQCQDGARVRGFSRSGKPSLLLDNTGGAVFPHPAEFFFYLLFEWDLAMRFKEKSEYLKVAPRLSAPNNFRNSRTSIPMSSRMCRQGIRMSSRLCGLPRTSF